MSRKKNEAIVIGKNITVFVISFHGDRVRLGIDAPKDVSINRREVQDAIDREAEKQRKESA